MSDQKTYLANLALQLCQLDPKTFGGIIFKTSAGSHMEQLRVMLNGSDMGATTVHPNLSAADLVGGIDPIESLTSGSLVIRPGVLDRNGWKLLIMADRLTRQSAALIAQHTEYANTDPFCVFDESESVEDTHLGPLFERFAFFFDLRNMRHDEFAIDYTNTKKRNTPLPTLTEDQQTLIVTAALQFGIFSMRSVTMVQKAAQLLASLDHRNDITQSDIDTAAQLILAHRATAMPTEAPETETNNDPVDQDQGSDTIGENETVELPEELVIDAVRAMLPADLLNQIDSKKMGRNSKGGDGFGLLQKSALRGRPLPGMLGRPNHRARIDILASLRAAAPWQKLRKSNTSQASNIVIYPNDLHIQRFQNRSERVVIFSVDASGSAAMSRMGEAKGAVEIMLAQAYSKRDYVALIGFRDGRADILLPPTRSLVQAKKNLAALAAGGGTPLATGINSALNLATVVRRSGKLPSMAFLTDGKGNIDIDGQPGRQKAMRDATHVAQMGRSLNVPTLFIDCGRRGNPELAKLAQTMGGEYLCLPRANAHTISELAKTHLE